MHPPWLETSKTGFLGWQLLWYQLLHKNSMCTCIWHKYHTVHTWCLIRNTCRQKQSLFTIKFPILNRLLSIAMSFSSLQTYCYFFLSICVQYCFAKVTLYNGWKRFDNCFLRKLSWKGCGIRPSRRCFCKALHLSRLVGKPTMWFPNRSDTNRPVQAQKRARSLKFRI